VNVFFYFVTITLGALVYPSVAYAYIDPGIGSLLLQGLAAAMISALLFLRTIREKIKDFFSGHKKREPAKEPENTE
jgi:hypothetical protein